MTHRKKLIEVALPLEAINEASAREKSIRHGHPSTLHLWWARRPLAAARAVIFTSLVDDPDDPNALPAFVEACKKLPIGANVKANGDTPRMRLFDFIERLVTWEATTDEAILSTARELIQIATEGNPPPLLDPFAGGGSIPLEAQRLGLEAHASDLNPVAVMINKAQIEIPPRFANRPPVNPRDRKGMFAPHPPAPSPTRGEFAPHPPAPSPTGGEFAPHPPAPSPTRGEFAPHPPAPSPTRGEGEVERISVSPALEKIMLEIARKLRRETTASEDILWQALRNRQLEGRKFRRQQPVGAFVLDFYCADERLAVEVDGPIHNQQKEADAQRQQILESLGIRFVRVTAEQVETDLPAVLAAIRAAFLSSPLTLDPSPKITEGLNSPSPREWERGLGGEGQTPHAVWERGLGGEGQDTTWRGAAGLAADVRYYGEWMREKAWERIGHLYPNYRTGDPPGRPNDGETVIAWLWARTVKSPNPAVNAHVPLVRSFILSKKKGRECWAKPVVNPLTPEYPLPPQAGERGLTPPPLSPSPHPAAETTPQVVNPLTPESPLPPQAGERGLTSPPLPPSPHAAAETTPQTLPPSPHAVWERGLGGEGQPTHTVRFEVTPGAPPKGQDGTVDRRGARCIISGEPIPFEYIRAEGKAARMGAMLMAIVTEGKNGRSYYSPTEEHARIAEQAQPEWIPAGDIPEQALGFRVQLYGMDEYNKLFTPRQLVALTTFSDLVHEAREQAYHDALAAGLPDDGIPLRDGGRGALAYAEAVSVYLAFAVDRTTNYSNTFTIWSNSRDQIVHGFGRQAIPMTWDYPEVNVFVGNAGDFYEACNSISKVIPSADFQGYAVQQDAAQLNENTRVIATDPPYYDMIGYADLSDFFYVWMRKSLRDVYPDIFGTMLVPKAPELIASPYRHGGKEAANQHFESGMFATFSNIRRFITPDYPLTVYYAFKQQDAEAVEEDEDPSPPDPLSHSKLGRGGKTPHPPAPSPTASWGEGGRKPPTVVNATMGSPPSPRSRRAVEDEEPPPSPRSGRAVEDEEPLPSPRSGRAVEDEEPLPSPRSGRGAGGEGLKTSTGWETMLTSLIDSGFSIDGTWPMRTERSTGLKATVNALASSIILVCRPRPDDAPTSSRRAFLDALRRELPAALKAMQSGSIAPVDLAQASIGPGMAIYSRYSNVLEADGSPMSVRTALGLINAALDEYLAEQDGDIDPDTRFAVAWFEQFGFTEGEFGQADVLARAKNTSVAGVESAGLVVAGRGKVRLVHWTEYDPVNARRGDPAGRPYQTNWDPTQDKRPTVWEATHHLIERLNTHGETGSALLMQKMASDMAAEARQLAYRLYSICERKGWADHARDYNALVMSWSGIGEEAARLRQEAASGDHTQQRGLFGDA